MPTPTIASRIRVETALRRGTGSSEACRAERSPADHQVAQRLRLRLDPVGERLEVEHQLGVELHAIHPPHSAVGKGRGVRRVHGYPERKRVSPAAAIDQGAVLGQQPDALFSQRAQGQRALAPARRQHHGDGSLAAAERRARAAASGHAPRGARRCATGGSGRRPRARGGRPRPERPPGPWRGRGRRPPARSSPRSCARRPGRRRCAESRTRPRRHRAPSKSGGRRSIVTSTSADGAPAAGRSNQAKSRRT